MRRVADGDLVAFATEFWSRFGARAHRDGEGSVFRVELPDALATHFGKKHLHYALTARDAWASGAEILAPGSRLIEQMYAYVKPRGVRAAFALLARPGATPASVKQEVLRRVVVGNAAFHAVSSAEAWPGLLAIDFKVVFETDVREEELVRIVEKGLAGGGPGELAVAAAESRAPWPEAREASAETAGKIWLPDLEQRFERMCEAARLEAAARAVAFEDETMARLCESLARLRGYFTQIKAEVAGDAERRAERIAELESEEARKVAEEVESHRVRVRVIPLAVMVLAVPTRRVDLRFRDEAGRDAVLRCDWDLSSGAVASPSLGNIPEAGVTLDLCREAHLFHAAGGGACAACGVAVCEEHAVRCGTCVTALCDGCAGRCLLCGARTCGDHAPRSCRVCGRLSCAPCLRSCGACPEGVVVCRDDAVACGVCGQAACPEHAVSCACGLVVCRQDVVVDAVSQIRYCGRCAIACSDCGRPIGRATSRPCASCGQRLCREDARGCVACGASSRSQPSGSAPLCRDHRTRCNACGGVLCRARHRKRCRLCARDVCAACLDSAQRCALCLELFRDRAPAPPPSPVPDEAQGCREWQRRAGHDFDLYLGRARDRSLLLVLDKEGAIVKMWQR